jgi:hypothetical protein
MDNLHAALQLSLEQRFSAKMQESQVRELSREQAQEMLIELMRQLMIKDNVIRHLMKKAL